MEDSSPEAVATAEKPTEFEAREQAIAELRTALVREGGVTQEQIDEWKVQYGQVAAFPMGDVIYFVRPLSRKEWRDFQQKRVEAQGNLMVDMDIEEEIAVRACLHPKQNSLATKTSGYAGLPTTISEAVSNLSGFMPGITPIIL